VKRLQSAIRRVAIPFCLYLPLSVMAAEQATLVRFVTCPVYRDADSGKKSGCWLGDDRATGIRYDVSQSPHKPHWNRAVLVEGRVSRAAANPCGGVVLEPVRTSILPEPCPRHMLPAEGYPGRKFVLPARNVAPMAVARKAPSGPFSERTFALFFEFDRDFIVYQYSDFLLDSAATWIAAAKPNKLIVKGFAATTPEVVSGQSLAERLEVAQERADKVAEALRRLFPAMKIETQTELAAQTVDLPDADGLPGQSQRRVEIRAVF
jgi:hypothetical protein